MHMMKIGELAARSGLTQSSIRFYENIGLLKTVERGLNGYRMYPEAALRVLDVIATAQKTGFSLDEVRAMLPSDLSHWNRDELVGTLRRKMVDIEAMEERLAQSKGHLAALIVEIESKSKFFDCSEVSRDVLSKVDHGEIDPPAMDAGDVRQMGNARRRA